MRRLVVSLVLAVVALALAGVALAGSPHFVGTPTVTTTSTSVTVSGKEAGLGNEDQVHIVVTADAACVNPGGNKPQAENKQTFSVAGDFPVQNGKAEFSLSLTPEFQPTCTPPMTLVFSNVTVTDTTSGISWP